MKLTRPDPIVFECADGMAFRVEPCTRAQMRAALALDPEPGEVRTPADAGAQRALQLAALVGPHVTLLVETADGMGGEAIVPSGPLLAELTPDEEMQILAALVAQGHGQNPADAAALQRLAQKKSVLAALSDSLHSTAIPSRSPVSSGSASPMPSGTASSPG